MLFPDPARGFESIAALPDASLIILAAPVRQNIELLSQVPVVSGFSRTVTDVGGTKREIVNAAADFAQTDPEPDASELWTDVYR